MTIAGDRVDADWIEQPHRWDIGFIKRFMLTFGLVSSLFDILTFAVLLWVLRSSPAEFRTGWFIESVVSAASIVLVVRTHRPLTASRPSRSLVLATVAVVILTLLLPNTPLGRLFGFVPLPPGFLLLLAAVLIAYVLTAERVKRWFYRDLPMVKGVRWFTTVIGESYVLECWAAFEDEAGWGAYRSGLASLKRDADWESRRTSQGEWWTFLDSRIVGDVPCRVGFGQMGATNSTHSPAAARLNRLASESSRQVLAAASMRASTPSISRCTSPRGWSARSAARATR
jgi:hypothetical protein